MEVLLAFILGFVAGGMAVMAYVEWFQRRLRARAVSESDEEREQNVAFATKHGISVDDARRIRQQQRRLNAMQDRSIR